MRAGQDGEEIGSHHQPQHRDRQHGQGDPKHGQQGRREIGQPLCPRPNATSAPAHLLARGQLDCGHATDGRPEIGPHCQAPKGREQQRQVITDRQRPARRRRLDRQDPPHRLTEHGPGANHRAQDVNVEAGSVGGLGFSASGRVGFMRQSRFGTVIDDLPGRLVPENAVQLPFRTPSCGKIPAISHHPSRVSKTAAAPKVIKRRVIARRTLFAMLSHGKISDHRIARSATPSFSTMASFLFQPGPTGFGLVPPQTAVPSRK